MDRTVRLVPRLRVVAMAVLVAATSFIVEAAPAAPTDQATAPLPFGLGPQTALAAYCATPNPALTGKLTQQLLNSGTPSTAGRITSGDVYAWISNVVDAWACTLYRRYDGLAWNTSGASGTFDWGTLINSISVSCNWILGETNYLKANDTGTCSGSDTANAMTVTLAPQGVYQADVAHDSVGDYSFAHVDCDTTPYYGAEVVKTGASFSGLSTTNRPGTNCDAMTTDTMGNSQVVTYDATPPAVGFDWPLSSGPALVSSAFAAVTFDATDAIALFDATHPWTLQRQSAAWNGTACGTFADDTSAGALVTGTVSALDQVSSQGLLDATCYRWTLSATDANGNSAAPITSGLIRTDLTANLGQGDQHTFERWDLGAGDGLAVNVGTGDLVLSHPIVSLPIRGGSLDLSLAYDRHDPSSVGMGPGWRLDAFRRLALNADGTVTFSDADGARHTFTSPVTVGTVTTYSRPPTLYAALVKDTALSANEFVLTYRDQSKDKFDIAGSEALLVREEDRHGNGVTLAYGAGTNRISTISDTAGGRTVSFSWDGSNRLTQIVDWANVNGAGVVQTSGAGNRTQRFFYDGAGNLAGWADPLNTTGSCPTGGSHLTCVAYPSAGLDISKTQTVTTLSGGVLGSTTQAATTKVTFSNADVTAVKDAQEVANGTAGSAFSHPAPYQTQVVRRGTAPSSADATTRYTLLAAGDPYARVGSVARKLTGAPNGGWLSTTTTWDATYPIEPASVTEDAGGSLARTTTTTYVPSSLGLVAKVVEPLTATDDRWTEYVYNANNDATQKTVSAEGSASDRTVTRTCYTTRSNSCPTSETGPDPVRVIEGWVSGGPSDEDTNVATDSTYDAYGQRTRLTRHNRAPDGSVRDDRIDAAGFDALGNQTSATANYADGLVTPGSPDIIPPAGSSVRTDLTTAFTYDTAGNRVSSADPRRAIAAAATTYARDAFGRTVSGSWGTADTGGTWSQASSELSVDGATGKIALGSITNRNNYLTAVSFADGELLAKVRIDRLATGDNHLMWFYLRRQGSNDYYEARLSFETSGLVKTSFARWSGGLTTTIKSQTTAVPHSTTDWYWLRARISGSSSVNAKLRLWKDGTTEPAGWDVDGTDASPPAALQGPGHIGVRFELGSGYTGALPATASFDELTWTTIGGGGQGLGADDYVTRWTFDARNAELTEVTPTTPGVSISQKTQSQVYDEFGDARAVTDVGGVVTATEADRVGRATRTFEDTPTVAAAATAETTYDPSGRILTDKDRRQIAGGLGATLHAYDELGRAVAVSSADGTTYETEDDSTYDALDRLTALEIGVGGPASQRTTYVYDTGGRLVRTDAESTCASATYDYRDLALTTTDGLVGLSCASGADTRTTTTTLDGLGRLTRAEVTAGPGTGDRTTDDTLDAVGNKLTAAVRKGGVSTTTSFTIDRLDQTVAEVRADGSTAKSTYDASGNAVDRCFWQSGPAGDCLPVGTLPWTDPPTKSTSTTYDARDERIGLVDSLSNQTTVYDPDHDYQVKAVYAPTLGDQTKELQSLSTYDDRHRLIELKHQLCTISSGHLCSASTIVAETDYAYDDTDHRTQVVANNGAATTDLRYCYDPLERLEYRNTGAACSSSAKDEQYLYDDTGNRTRTVLGAAITDFAYDPQGRLCKTGATTCTSPNVTYDTAGRTKSWNGWTFAYDPDGRMVSACKSPTCASGFDKVEFAYDGEGHRTSITTTTAAGAIVTRTFRYQSDAIVEERLTDAGHPSGAVVRSYTVDDTGTVVKLVIPAPESDAGTYLPVFDGHGDAQNLSRLEADGSLTLANSYRFESWGRPSTLTHNGIGDLGFRFTYVGEFDVQWDDQLGLGLLYMHARHYSPALGRFLQPDPDRSEANLYAYAKNDPVTELDPDGTCFILCAIANALIDTGIYLATTDRSEWSLGGAASAAATGAVTGFLGVGLLSKIGKVGALARAGSKLLGKVPRAGRFANRVASGTRTFFNRSRASQAGQFRIPGGPRAGTGRAYKQSRLGQIAADDKAPSHVRGWLRQEQNSIARGQRSTIRVPPGYQLAHGRTTPARRGFSYLFSKLQSIDLHRLQHRVNGY